MKNTTDKRPSQSNAKHFNENSSFDLVAYALKNKQEECIEFR